MTNQESGRVARRAIERVAWVLIALRFMLTAWAAWMLWSMDWTHGLRGVLIVLWEGKP